MDTFKKIFQKESVKKILILVALVIIFSSMKSIFNLVLLIFLITYLMDSLQNKLVSVINKFFKVSPAIITALVYSLVTVSLVLVGVKYIPIVIKQSVSMIEQLKEIDLTSNKTWIGKYLAPIIKQVDISDYAQKGVDGIMEFAAGLGKFSVNMLIAFILSLIFILEKSSTIKFVRKFEKSKIAGVYRYLRYFGENFLNSFGKVIQAQIMIAIVNTVLSVIGLFILGFPQLFALTFMIFILSLIPVAGVIISLIPLSLIAFEIGGIMKIIYVFIMVMAIHALESYVLNPKLMSNKTNIPVFFTFIILIFSEHFMGIWGLLLGIPLFIFILDLLELDISKKDYMDKAAS